MDRRRSTPTPTCPVDARGVTFSYAFFIPKHGGVGQFYLMTINDAAGQPFDGASTHRLNVPADAPVELYWSVTIYDRATHALIRDMPWASRSSLTPGCSTTTTAPSTSTSGPERPTATKPADLAPRTPSQLLWVRCLLGMGRDPMVRRPGRVAHVRRWRGTRRAVG